MEANEPNQHSSQPGIPKIGSEWILTYRELPTSYNEQLEDLKRDQASLAREIFIRGEILSRNDPDKKRAYIRGALFMYGLINFAMESEELEALFRITGESDESPSVGDGGEVLPPSA